MTDAVGIQTGPIFDDPDTRAKGVDAIPSTLGERFLGDFASNPTQEIGRAFGRYFAATGVDPSTGIYTGFQPAAPISPDEANTRYGISDHLEFTNPINPDVAASMYDAKRAELQQQDVLRRQPSGVGNTVAGLATDFLAASLDPLSIASTFIPVVGQARYARWLEEAGSTLARTGIRAGVGAAQGVAGQAPLVALRYGLSQQEGADYSATDALLDLTYGGLLGAGLNAGAGAFADALHGPFKSAPGRAASGVNAVADAPLAVQEGALRTSLAQMADGRPIEVEPYFSAADVLGGTTRTVEDLDRKSQAMLAGQSDDSGLNRDLDVLRGKAAMPQMGSTILTELRRFGPVKDEGGELAAIGITSKTNPGMISKTGRSLDDAARHIGELGYFPELGGERPSITDLLNALYDEQHGSPRFHPDDATSNAHLDNLKQLDQHLHERGIDLGTMSNAEVADVLRGRAERGPATLADHDAQAAAYANVTRGGPLEQATRYAAGEQLPEHVAMSNMAEQATAAPSAIDQQIAELEGMVRHGQSTGELPAMIPELDAANVGVTRAQAVKRGIAQAAFCLARGGA